MKIMTFSDILHYRHGDSPGTFFFSLTSVGTSVMRVKRSTSEPLNATQRCLCPNDGQTRCKNGAYGKQTNRGHRTWHSLDNWIQMSVLAIGRINGTVLACRELRSGKQTAVYCRSRANLLPPGRLVQRGVEERDGQWRIAASPSRACDLTNKRVTQLGILKTQLCAGLLIAQDTALCYAYSATTRRRSILLKYLFSKNRRV